LRQSGNTDIERRISRLEDRAELKDLVVQYFLATDTDDFEALTDLLDEQVTLRTEGGLRASGRDAVIASIRDARSNLGATLHTPDSVLLTLKNEREATGVVGAHFEVAYGNTTMYGAAKYIDDYLWADGRWRILNRNMMTIHMGPWGDVASSLTARNRIRWPHTGDTPPYKLIGDGE
jgi:hypothetical protein